MSSMASVFVIDDNLSACFAIANLLTREGFAVRTAHSGRDALSVIEQERPDLVVCDLRLPDIDGLEVSTAVTERWRRGAPVVLVSGIVTDEICQAAAHAGAAAVFQKPFDVPAFLDTVRRLLITPVASNASAIDFVGWLPQRREEALARLLGRMPRVRGMIAMTRPGKLVFAHGDLAHSVEMRRALDGMAASVGPVVDAAALEGVFQVELAASGGRVILDVVSDPLLAIQLEGHDLMAEARARSLLTSIRKRLAS